MRNSGKIGESVNKPHVRKEKGRRKEARKTNSTRTKKKGGEVTIQRVLNTKMGLAGRGHAIQSRFNYPVESKIISQRDSREGIRV